jgi:hypothetical protein
VTDIFRVLEDIALLGAGLFAFAVAAMAVAWQFRKDRKLSPEYLAGRHAFFEGQK